MSRRDWNEPVTATDVPLWRMALALYGELGSYAAVRTKLKEKFGISVSYHTLHQQIRDHATPGLRRKDPSRRELRDWLIEFLREHGIDMDEWVQFAARKEAEDG